MDDLLFCSCFTRVNRNRQSLWAHINRPFCATARARANKTPTTTRWHPDDNRPGTTPNSEGVRILPYHAIVLTIIMIIVHAARSRRCRCRRRLHSKSDQDKHPNQYARIGVLHSDYIYYITSGTHLRVELNEAATTGHQNQQQHCRLCVMEPDRADVHSQMQRRGCVVFPEQGGGCNCDDPSNTRRRRDQYRSEPIRWPAMHTSQQSCIDLFTYSSYVAAIRYECGSNTNKNIDVDGDGGVWSFLCI